MNKELIYDDLVFDDRNQDELFPGINPCQLHYADILKRWVSGNNISEVEKRIVSSILTYYPEYPLKNFKSEEYIELIRHSLHEPDLLQTGNPEKGLSLYTLFYFLLKTGAYKEALLVLCDLENVLREYNNSQLQILKDPVLPLSLDDILYPEEYPAKKTDRVQEAYIEIISRIIDTKELLLLEPGFNFNRLPLPNRSLCPAECRDMRGNALYLYEQKSYSEAKKIYQRLLMERFESPGTLIHLARLALTAGDTEQTEIYVEMAWRHRVDAPPYVMARILWFRLCLVLIETGNRREITLILDQLKTLLQNKDALMMWAMQPLLEQLKPELQENDHRLLNALVDTMSNGENITKLDSLTNYFL